MINNQQVGRNLMLLRLQKGLSQQGLAEMCNVTHQAVSKWENGAALPDMQTMLFLSKYYGVSMEAVLSGEISLDAEEEKAETLPAMPEPPAVSEEQETPPESQMEAPVLTWQQIIGLAPFASRETLETLARRCEDQADMDILPALAPFLSREYLDELVTRVKITDTAALLGLAPFLSKQTLDRLLLGGNLPIPARRTAPKEERESPRLHIARKAAAEGNMDWLEEHFDELNGDEIKAVCALMAGSGHWEELAELAEEMEMDSDGQEALVKEAIQREQDDFLLNLVENVGMSSDTLRLILDYAMAKSNWELINALTDEL